MEEDFLTDDGTLSGFKGMRPFSETWIRYIMEYQLPDADKKEIIRMLRPIMDVAAKGNIRRQDIPMYLDDYDIIWHKYKMYMKKGKYDPELLTLEESLRLGFELQATRSVDMGQMRMIFEPKSIQSVFQRFIDASNKKLGFFKKGKPPSQQEEMM